MTEKRPLDDLIRDFEKFPRDAETVLQSERILKMIEQFTPTGVRNELSKEESRVARAARFLAVMRRDYPEEYEEYVFSRTVLEDKRRKVPSQRQGGNVNFQKKEKRVETLVALVLITIAFGFSMTACKKSSSDEAVAVVAVVNTNPLPGTFGDAIYSWNSQATSENSGQWQYTSYIHESVIPKLINEKTDGTTETDKVYYKDSSLTSAVVCNRSTEYPDYYVITQIIEDGNHTFGWLSGSGTVSKPAHPTTSPYYLENETTGLNMIATFDQGMVYLLETKIIPGLPGRDGNTAYRFDLDTVMIDGVQEQRMTFYINKDHMLRKNGTAYSGNWRIYYGLEQSEILTDSDNDGWYEWRPDFEFGEGVHGFIPILDVNGAINAQAFTVGDTEYSIEVAIPNAGDQKEKMLGFQVRDGVVFPPNITSIPTITALKVTTLSSTGKLVSGGTTADSALSLQIGGTGQKLLYTAEFGDYRADVSGLVTTSSSLTSVTYENGKITGTTSTMDANDVVQATTFTATFQGVNADPRYYEVTATLQSIAFESGTTLEIREGSTKQLVLNRVYSADSSSPLTNWGQVTLSSADEAKVTVSATGLMTAVAPTTANVNVTATFANKTATVAVKVRPALTSFTTEPTGTITLEGGQTRQIAVSKIDTTEAEDSTLTGVTFASANEATATVSAGGLITAANDLTSIQTTTITVSYEDKQAQITVSVIPQIGTTGSVTPNSVAMTYAVSPSATTTLTASFTAVEGTAITDTAMLALISWTTADATVATVSGSGKTATVTAVKSGTATITATLGSRSFTSTVNVNALAVGIEVTGSASVASGSTAQLVLKELLADTTTGQPVSGTVSWSSSDTDVITVASSTTHTAIITAVAPGTATITATGGSDSATLAMTVTPVISSREIVGVSAIEPDGTATYTLKENYQGGSSATVNPASWESSTVATATSVTETDGSFTLTGIAAGTTTITAKDADGNTLATKQVEVSVGFGDAYVRISSTGQIFASVAKGSNYIIGSLTGWVGQTITDTNGDGWAEGPTLSSGANVQFTFAPSYDPNGSPDKYNGIAGSSLLDVDGNYHVTFEGGVIKFYLNGVEIASSSE